MNIFRITSILLAAFSLSASASMSLICDYYKLHTDPLTEQFGTWEGGYLFAENELQGYLEDGFWVTKQTIKQAQKDCINSIDTKKGPDFQLLMMKAGNMFIENSVVFSDTAARIVVFGDSLSDEGNLKKWVQLYPAWPYFMGRYSNGPIWTEYLRSTANVSILNWAYGGGTSTQFLSPWHTVITSHLEAYVSSYIAQLSSQEISSPEETIFLFWIGSNDLNYGGQSEDAIRGIKNQIKRLAEAGGKRFAVLNMLDYSLSPCGDVCWDQTKIFNKIWRQELKDLNEADIQVTYINIEDAHQRIVEEHRMNNSRCFKGYWKTGSLDPSKDTCSEVNRSFFYDDVHPTTFGHCWLTYFIHKGLHEANFVASKPELDLYKIRCESPAA